ncbi:MAG: zinc ribbon domain-containing protein [Eubacterium sp.]|nr:zinc ribbon domain-containing protein [Eubacterium sp.]
MGFFDGIGKKVTDVGQMAIQKTKETSDIARISSLISQEESKINNTYYQVGKLYVSIHGSEREDNFVGMIDSIAEMENKIADYRKQIQEIKGVQHCKNCGAEVPRGVAFCSFCGSPMPKLPIQNNSQEYTKCLSCGAVVKKGSRFCTACGQPMLQSLPQEIPDTNEVETVDIQEPIDRRCPNCGEKQAEDSLFCTECGAKLL